MAKKKKKQKQKTKKHRRQSTAHQLGEREENLMHLLTSQNPKAIQKNRVTYTTDY